MDLQFDKLNITLVFELGVNADIEMDPKQVVDIIASEIRIRKKYDGFSISGFDMDYEVRKNQEMLKV